MSEKRDQALRDIVKGAGIVYVGLVLEVVIAFLAQVLAARFLSIGGFGGITTGTALLNIGAIVASLGYGEGLTRYLPRVDDAEKVAITRFAFFVAIPVSIVLAAIVVLRAEFIATEIFGDPTVVDSIRVFGAAIPFSTVLSVGIGGIRGQKAARYRVYVKNLLHPIFRFTLVIVAVVYGLGQIGFAAAYAIPYALAAVVAVYLLSRTLSLFSQVRTDRGLYRDFTEYSVPFVIGGAAGFLYRSVDIFLLLYILDSEAVGVYAVAYAAARLILMFSTAFNFLGSPVASELQSEEGIAEAISVNSTVLRWLVVAAVPTLVPLVFFPAEFISIIYRPNYATGATAMVILTLAFAVHTVFSAQHNLLEAVGNSRVLALNNVLAGTTNVVLNLLLIPRIGIEGAAVATAVSYLMQDALMIVELRWETGRWAFDTSVFTPVVVAIPCYVGFGLLTGYVPGTLLWIVSASGAFTLVFGLFYLVTVGLQPAEVMLIRSAEERFGVDVPGLDRFLQWFS